MFLLTILKTLKEKRNWNRMEFVIIMVFGIQNQHQPKHFFLQNYFSSKEGRTDVKKIFVPLQSQQEYSNVIILKLY